MTDRRVTGLAVSLGVASLWLLSRLHAADPLQDWPLLRLAPGFGCALLLAVGCLLSGRRVVRWLTAEADAEGELSSALAAGLLLFFLLVFLGGLLGLFGGPFFFGVIAALWGVGLWGAPRPVRLGLWLPGRLTLLDAGLLAGGLIGLAVVIVPVFALDNLSFDARWYHLALGEQYAVAGGLVDFREGSVQASVSHLTSWLNAWAFQWPGDLVERLMLTRWIEVFALVATLAGVPALVRSLCPDLGPRPLAWVGFFLFPSIFVYDTGLLGAADHVCAVFTIPAWLALVRFWERPSPRAGVLLALPVAGLALSKYTAVVLLLPIGVAAVAAAARHVKSSAGSALGGVGAFLLGALALTAPHWLTLTILRGSPLYPALCGWLECRPWTPTSAAWVERYVSESADLAGAPGSVAGAMMALIDFSWGRYTFLDFHGQRPVFGSLFTLVLPALLFLPTPRRVWALVLSVHASVLLWYLVARQERYLVPLVPLMTGVVMVAVSLAWRERGRVCALVVGLVCVQLLAAADGAVLPSHRAHGEAPLVRGLRALGAGFKGTREEHLRDFRAFSLLGEALPRDALVLLHRNVIHLGINRRVMTDTVPHALGLDYASLGTPQRIRERLVSLGVTHVGMTDAPDQDSLAGELLFRSFAASMTRPLADVAGWRLFEIGPPVAAAPVPAVLVAGCGAPLADGLYRLSALAAPVPPVGVAPASPVPLTTGPPATLFSQAGYVVLDPRCASTAGLGPLQPLGPRGDWQLFLANTVVP